VGLACCFIRTAVYSQSVYDRGTNSNSCWLCCSLSCQSVLSCVQGSPREMLPPEASPYPTIAASVWCTLSSLDYDHMQLQLLPQLWQATIVSACDQDCTNALDLTDVAVLGEIVALPPSSPVKPDRNPHPLSSPTGSLKACALAKRTAPGSQ